MFGRELFFLKKGYNSFSEHQKCQKTEYGPGHEKCATFGAIIEPVEIQKWPPNFIVGMQNRQLIQNFRSRFLLASCFKASFSLGASSVLV
jgi:hypothetical protein